MGGSLLDMADIGEHFCGWLATQEPAQNWVIVGGGDAVEAMRTLDRVHQFPKDKVHWWCVDLLSTTAKVASHLLTIPLISTPGDLQAALGGLVPSSGSSLAQSYVIDVSTFYSPERGNLVTRPESVGDSLPEDWSTTTDSIAAYFATVIGGTELVLLKSTSVSAMDIQKWSRDGIVDDYFPQAADGIESVRIVNFRDLTG
ncbi:MAG: hypothetical protein AAGG44_09280 [Planctomycetota bacterium]